MAILYMPIGPSGCGKSTYGYKLKERNEDLKVISSDKIRQQLYGEENIQGDPKEVFKIMQLNTVNYLSKGFNVYYDATNLRRKHRAEIIQNVKKLTNAQICAIIIASDYETCCKNQHKRDRLVPEEVIKRQFKSFEMPFKFEGFDEIRLMNYMEPRKIEDWYDESVNVMHDNAHHNVSIGHHCELVEDNFKSLIPHIGALHDCGKVFTKDFHNTKGEETKEAHYYSHENVSAYFSFGYDKNLDEEMLIARAQIISLHMKPLVCGEKKLKFYKENIPHWMWEKVQELYKIDLTFA